MSQLKKNTVSLLRSYVNDFDMSVDDVVFNLIKENQLMKSLINEKDMSICNSKDNYLFGDYVIHKLPKGKILVTKDGLKVNNMKKIIISAGKEIGMKDEELIGDLTTYEVGRLLFRYISCK